MKTVAESKILKTIDEIREYIDDCKTVPLMPGKIMVNRDEFDELIDELEASTPEEIKKCREIVAKYDEIIGEAENLAKRKLDETSQEMNKLLSENEIMLQAYQQADAVVEEAQVMRQNIIDKAMMEANEIRESSLRYMDDMLQNMQNLLAATMQTNEKKFQDMQANLDHYYQIVLANRQEINGGSDDGSGAGSAPANGATGEINIDMM